MTAELKVRYKVFIYRHCVPSNFMASRRVPKLS